jgi:hypothetical protein
MKFEEGQDYFALEVNPEGEHTIALSCWDDESEVICREQNKNVFPTLREALNHCKKNSVKEVVYYDYTISHGIYLKV